MVERLVMSWVAIASICSVLEMLTARLVVIWFATGAGLAAIAAYYGVDLIYQWVIFLAFALPMIPVSRKLVERIFEAAPTIAAFSKLLGQTAIVVEEIDPEDGTGRIRAGDEEWGAIAAPNVVIPKGRRVTVVDFKGSKLLVE